MKRSNKYISLIRKYLIGTLTACVPFFTLISVSAGNDDEYLTLTDFYTWTAFNFFSSYGLSADKEYSYIDEYTSSGTVSYNGSISLSSSSGISLTGDGESWFEGIIRNITEPYDLIMGFSNYPAATVERQNSDPTYTMSCTFNDTNNTPPADNTIKGSCIYLSSGATRDTYEISLNNDGGIVLSTTEHTTGVMFGAPEMGDSNSTLKLNNSYVINGSLSGSENGSLEGNATLSLTTSTTNINSLKYSLPVLKGVADFGEDNINLQRNKLLSGNQINPIVIAFLQAGTSANFSGNFINNRVTAYNSNFEEIQMNYTSILNRSVGGGTLVAFEAYSTDAYNIFLKWNTDVNTQAMFSTGIIPLYVGQKAYITDDLYRYLYGRDRTIDAINTQGNALQNILNTIKDFVNKGDSNTTNIVNENTSITNDFETQNSELFDIENDVNSDMNNALNDIDSSNAVTHNSKFLYSVDWIREQFNRMVLNTPFENVIVFCLVLGLGLLLLGKVR